MLHSDQQGERHTVPRARRHAISRREREVLALVAAGLTNREIAERLHLSPWTVKRHVANLLRKVGVRRRVQLALWFLRLEMPP